MKNILFKKGSVIALVGFLIVISFSPLVSSINKDEKKGETVLVDGIICGYVTDGETGFPIENAKVDIQRWSTYWNHTYTGSSGFYTISVPAATIRLHVHADGYLSRYQGNYDLEDGDIIWANVSLLPRFPETSTVYGYVTDVETSDPLVNANVKIKWRMGAHHYENNTPTDSNGFYSMSIAAGEIQVCAYLDGYFTNCWQAGHWYDIEENETVQADISMHTIPLETSVVCGYITDSATGDPIEGAHVSLHWNNYGHSQYNDTFTDSTGFYNMNIAAGNFRLMSINADGYWVGCTPYYAIGDNEIMWLNKSLDPYDYIENSVVCGYATDHDTGDPIEGVYVVMVWRNDQGHSVSNSTNTDSFGYYSINVAAGEFYIVAYSDEHFRFDCDYTPIGENEIIWVNFSMYPIPSVNAYIQGHVTDADTGEPIKDVFVDVMWRDGYGHNMWFSDETDDNGYYCIQTAAGEIRINAWADYYCEFITNWFYIEENESLWFNFSMEPYSYPPYPPTITGPTSGKVGIMYNYTFVTDDYNGDDVYYYIEWGDGTSTGWIGPYESGEEIIKNHTWNTQGTYLIKSKAKNIHDAESDWAYLEVTMPRNSAVSNPFLFKILNRFMSCFPLLERLIFR